MTVAVYLPVAMSVLLALTAGPLSARLSPRSGLWGLTLAAAVVAVSSLWTLSLLLVSLVDDLPTTPLLHKIPVPDVVSVCAGAALVWCGARVAGALARRRELRRGLDDVVASGDDGELVVVGDRRPHAFAVAGRSGRPGRIVVSAAMLRALTPAQRRAMLAHERAHLQRGHLVALAVVQLAAAANPLLGTTATAVGYLCERHADELAAEEVGDRYVVAEALTAAALATTSAAAAQPAFHRLNVVDRVTALVGPHRPYRSAGLVTASAIAAVAFSAALDATDQFYELVHRAVTM